MKLNQLVDGIDGFFEWSHSEKIRFFCWYLHSFEGRGVFGAADVLDCYDLVHLDRPGNIYQLLKQMTERRPKVVLKDGQGYKLEKRVRDALEAKYGRRPTAIGVDALLTGLPGLIPAIGEREFLDEALRCFQVGAFRASIVMCWNLTFDHLCSYVLSSHLASFNQSWPRRHPGHHAQSRFAAVSRRDDFSDFKESQVIEICRAAGIISGDIEKILREKLDGRNSAAHPSGVVISQLKAESYIDDLVRNVVLRLV